MNQNQNNNETYSKKIINEEIKEGKKSTISSNQISYKKKEKDITKIKTYSKFKTDNNCLPKYWRFDMVKKYWKSKINIFGQEQINKNIEESNLPDELKCLIHKPNSLLFTSKVTVTENLKFLGYSMREVFTIGKEKGNLQRQNDNNISQIFNYFENIGYSNLSDNLKKIKEFFEMSYEDLIIKFYDSYEFIKFKKNDKKIKFYDNGTKEQEGFSLLEKYGLIKLFKMLNKKRKRD